MAFKKKLKWWHGIKKKPNNIFNNILIATSANKVFRLPPKTFPLGH